VDFQGKQKKQFEDTIKTIQETQPDITNVSRYWKRGKTSAEKMPNQISNSEIMKRSEKISRISRKISLELKKKDIGWVGEVIVNEKGSRKEQWKARTPAYKQVIINGNLKLGKKIKIRVKESTLHDLIAEAKA